MGSKFKRAMTDKEMERIRRAVSRSVIDPDLTAILIFYVRIAGLRLPWTEDIDPTEYQLPRKQWGKVFDWICRNSKAPTNPTVMRGGRWMNAGPSSF